MKPCVRCVVAIAVTVAVLLLNGPLWGASKEDKKVTKTGSSSQKTSDNPDPKGDPNFKPGLSRRFVIWNDDVGWHVRTTSANPKMGHVFEGAIRIEGGTVVSIANYGNLETNIKKGQTASPDVGRVNSQRNLIAFKFKTGVHADGFDFKVSDKAEKLNITLRLDGNDPADQIFIGKKGQHPTTGAFTLPAHP